MKKGQRSMLAWLMVFAMTLSIATVPESVAAKTIKLSNCTTVKVMPVGSTFQLKTNQKAENLKFVSNKKKIVSVSQQGLLQAGKKGTATITITSGKTSKKIKVKVKAPTGYTITKKAGNYTKTIKTTVKTKKGYTVYYTIAGKFKKSQSIPAKKTKTFHFSKTTTLKLYPVKSTVKMTTAKLNKTEMTNKNRGDYLYQIVAATNATPAVTATGGSVGSTSTPANTVHPDATAGTGSTFAPTASTPAENPIDTGKPVQPTPEGTASANPVSTPGDSEYIGDDSMSDYVACAPAVYEEEDTDTSIPADAVEITIPTNATGVKVSEESYEISKKNKLTILKAGSYVLHTESVETASESTIEIDKTVSGTIHLILDGVNLKAAPDIDEGVLNFTNKNDLERKIVITVKEGTTNQITDTGISGLDEENAVDYPAGILCKKTPLTINGTGSLQIISENGNGIKATHILKILDAEITVHGGQEKGTGHNGISGKLGVFVKDAVLNISSSGDGLKTTLDESDVAQDSTLAELGNMTMEGGSYYVTSASGDAISVYRTLKLSPEHMEVITENQPASTDSSCKGVKAGETIYIPSTAGTIVADTTATYSENRINGESNDSCADDTIHCDGYILINGGNLDLSSGDDGIHADNGIVINNGTILIRESYEGIESADITMNGGNITITSRDDGINAGGGNDSVSDTNPGGGMGGDHFDKGDSSVADQYQVIINGGTVTIDADGDGIDSNGNIFFKGGIITVNGPENGGNGALDYGDKNCVCEISGGTLIAAGAVGMDDAPTSGSTQPVVNVVLSAPQKAGTYVVIKDTSGNIVMTAQPTKTFQSVVMSCDKLELGSSYIVYIGDSLEQLTEAAAFTFTSVSVTTGSVSTGGWNPGGPGSQGPGGNQPGGGNRNGILMD